MIKRVVIKQQFVLPPELGGEGAEDIWEISSLAAGGVRQYDAWLLNNRELITPATGDAWQAWKTFVSTTIKWEDGQEIMIPNLAFDLFLKRWDEFPAELIEWIMKNVREVNPRFRQELVAESG